MYCLRRFAQRVLALYVCCTWLILFSKWCKTYEYHKQNLLEKSSSNNNNHALDYFKKTKLITPLIYG